MEAPDRNLGFLLHDTARMLRKRFEQNARHLGLTRAQWQVMATLARNEGLHQGALAELLEIEPITLVRILDRLQANGLIERRLHPTDRRLRLLHLTAAAHPILERIREVAAQTREEAFAGIPPEAREHLLEMLLTTRANLSGRNTEDDEQVRHG